MFRVIIEHFSVFALLIFADAIVPNRCQERRDLTFCIPVTYGGRDEQFKVNNCRHIKEELNDDIRCHLEVDRLRCLEQLLSGTADFGVFKAEDVFLAPFINQTNAENLVITNELRQSPNQSHEFDMVALVSNMINVNSFADLAGTRLCHPGFDENGWLYDWSEIFSQYFEENVIPERCESSLSVFENKIKSLSSFFESACKAGSWSPDPVVDEKLKMKYSNLCANCKIQAACSRNDGYWGQQGPLTCLTECSGDVSWVRLQDIDVHFRMISDLTSSQELCLDISFLCPDGTKQPRNSTNPCVWLARPWPVIIARRAVREKVSALIEHLNSLSNTLHADSWEYKLRVLFSQSLKPIPAVIPNNLTPLQYLQKIPGFLKANNLSTCKNTGEDKVINICVGNNLAKNKCDLMALVAQVYSIDPDFKCKLADDCAKSVAQGESDVLIVSTESLKHAYLRHDMKTILYQTSIRSDELRYISAVVPHESKIKKLKELRGKKACFSEVGGLGWNSLLMVLKENSLIDDYCDEKSALLKFFSEVCIINNKPDDGIHPCFDDDFEKFDLGSLDLNEAQGLRCIAVGGGDVAFIDFYSVDRYLNEYRDKGWFGSYYSARDFRPICPYKNSTLHDCYLSRASFGQILARNDTADDRIEEITSAFLLLDSILKDDENRNPIFKMFTHYQNEKNILFESRASRLEQPSDLSNRIDWANNIYELKLMDMIITCQKEKMQAGFTSASSLISISVISFVLPITIFSVFVSNSF